MRRVTTLAGLVWLFVPAHTSRAFQATVPATVVEDPFARYATIFVAELVSVQPMEGCDLRRNPNCALRVRACVSRILKDRNKQGLVPETFDAVIPPRPSTIFSVPPGWATVWNIEVGQPYLVSSVRQGELISLFESPQSVLLLSDDNDAVADVELILGVAQLSFAEKVSAVAAAIANPSKGQGFFLAGYAMSLLRAGSPSDTLPLVQAIEKCSVSAFSNPGWDSLLFHLSDIQGTTPKLGDLASHLLVELTARYLVFAPDRPKQHEPDPDGAIRERYLPWIRSSESSLVDFRAALRGLLIDSRTKFTPEQRARLFQWIRDAESWSVTKPH